jgi:hypothetical protein
MEGPNNEKSNALHFRLPDKNHLGHFYNDDIGGHDIKACCR